MTWIFCAMTPRFTFLAATLLTASMLGSAQAAAPTVPGQVHFLFLDANELPMPGLTLSGNCESRLGSFWNPTKHPAPWSCTTSSDGICTATIETLAQPDGAPVQCRGTDRSTVQEKGTEPQRISYLAFFAKGVKDNYALVQKRAGWKDGQYTFKSVDNLDLFDALALRYRSRYYTDHLQQSQAPNGTTVLSLQAAHPQENPDEQNLVYLRGARGAGQIPTTVDVVMDLTYVDEVIRRYDKAEFEGLQGTQTTTLTTVSDGNTCSVRDLLSGQCKYRESLELPLNLNLVKALAGKYQEGVPGNWRLRITTPRGQQLEFLIAYAEFAALSKALEP